MRSVVVLPEPDGPSIEKNSPWAISRSMPATASTSPKTLRTFSSRTAAGASDSASGAGPSGPGSAACAVVGTACTRLLVGGRDAGTVPPRPGECQAARPHVTLVADAGHLDDQARR